VTARSRAHHTPCAYRLPVIAGAGMPATVAVMDPTTGGSMQNNPAPAGGALDQEITKLLGSFGVVADDARDTVVDALQQVLDAAGLDARVASVRWGRAVVEAGPTVVAKLRYHLDQLVDCATEASGGDVTHVQLRVSDRKATT